MLPRRQRNNNQSSYERVCRIHWILYFRQKSHVAFWYWKEEIHYNWLNEVSVLKGHNTYCGEAINMPLNWLIYVTTPGITINKATVVPKIQLRSLENLYKHKQAYVFLTGSIYVYKWRAECNSDLSHTILRMQIFVRFSFKSSHFLRWYH